MLQETAANHGRGCLWMIYRKVKTQAGYDRCGSPERSVGQMWLMSDSASVDSIIVTLTPALAETVKCGPKERALSRLKQGFNSPSRSLQPIRKDFVIRFAAPNGGGGNHGCEGEFGKEICCAVERR